MSLIIVSILTVARGLTATHSKSEDEGRRTLNICLKIELVFLFSVSLQNYIRYGNNCTVYPIDSNLNWRDSEYSRVTVAVFIFLKLEWYTQNGQDYI